MNTKILMTFSAFFLGAVGIALSFLPKEILTYLAVDSSFTSVLLFQIMGSLYLGFAILNWMTKDSRIGGIYNKPLSIANFMHFMVGSITLLKSLFEVQSQIIISLAIIYTVLSISFAYVFMTNPKN